MHISLQLYTKIVFTYTIVMIIQIKITRDIFSPKLQYYNMTIIIFHNLAKKDKTNHILDNSS